jgi:hypothetical protein
VSSVNRRLSVLCAGDEGVPGVGREVCHGVHVACGEAGDHCWGQFETVESLIERPSLRKTDATNYTGRSTIELYSA